MRKFVALSLVALFSVTIAPSPASAENPCLTPVVDETDARVIDIDRATAAVTDIRNATGADVYVRTYQNTPTENAETWWKEEYRKCWISPDGETPKTNVLVVMFGLDRQSAIKYGENLTGKLNKKVDGIRGRTLGNGLREANGRSGIESQRDGFTLAITDTLSALNSAINAAPEAPKDWSGFWRGVWTAIQWLFYTALIAVASVFGFKGARRGLEYRRDKMEAHSEFVDARTRASDAVVDIDLTAMFHRADAAKSGIDTGYVPEHTEESIRERLNEQSAAFIELENGPKPKSLDELLDATDAYSAVADEFIVIVRDAEDYVRDVEKEAKRCTVARDEYAKIVKRAKTLGSVTLDDHFNSMKSAAQGIDSGKIFSHTEESLSARFTAINNAVEDLNNLPEPRNTDEYLERYTAYAEVENDAQELNKDAKGTADAMKSESKRCSASVKDSDVSRADKAVRELRDQLANVPSGINIESIVSALDGAESKLSNAGSLNRHDLDKLLDSVQNELTHAQSCIHQSVKASHDWNAISQDVLDEVVRYRNSVSDVSEDVRDQTLSELERIHEGMKSFHTKLTGGKGLYLNEVLAFISETQNAMRTAVSVAVQQQDDARRERERLEAERLAEERRRREKREREEREREEHEREERQRKERREREERERRSSDFGIGFGGGFGGGFSSGSSFDGGGGGFGGGSSGSW